MLARAARSVLERLLGVTALRTLHARARSVEGATFEARALATLGIRYTLSGPADIPALASAEPRPAAGGRLLRANRQPAAHRRPRPTADEEPQRRL